ncbi:MAG: GTP-binding protein HflX [Chthoniobacteraceae bacterium]|nr:GTP-binding protein HflX [Chthoniobacteraceae bacterium]
MTDTVGFVRKLPHRLIEAFNATLEEAVIADFLIHLLDASQPEVMEFYNTTMKVLKELGAEPKHMLVVFNKIDKVEDPAIIANLRRHFPDAQFISIYNGTGIDALVERISEYASDGSAVYELRLPSSAADVVARLHRAAKILETEYLDDGVRIVVFLSARLAADYSEYIVDRKTGRVGEQSPIQQ